MAKDFPAVEGRARHGQGSRNRALGESRRAGILASLQEEGRARVKALGEAFDVSEVAVRLDLEKLVQTLFLAAAAIDPETGLTYPALSDIAVKRAMFTSF